MKRIYFLMLLSCVFACERHDVPETVVEEPDVEITASFDSLSTSRAYYSISVGTDVRAGRYKFVWTASTDNRYEPLRAERLTCICPDTSFAVSCGDSLDIVPGQKLGISSSCSIYQTGTHSFDFELTSASDTLECEIAFIRPLVYNYDLMGISNSQRYSLISEEWANYHGEAYFPFTFPQDSIVRIGRHLKDIIMPDIYKPATYISDYEFKVTAEVVCKLVGSIFRYVVEAPVRTLAAEVEVFVRKSICACACGGIRFVKIAELIVIHKAAVKVEQIKIALEIAEGNFAVKLNV